MTEYYPTRPQDYNCRRANMSNLKVRILQNRFADKLRNKMIVDHEQYVDLCLDLEALAIQCRGSSIIDRELALILYCLPQIARNQYLSFRNNDSIPEIAQQLEYI